MKKILLTTATVIFIITVIATVGSIWLPEKLALIGLIGLVTFTTFGAITIVQCVIDDNKEDTVEEKTPMTAVDDYEYHPDRD